MRCGRTSRITPLLAVILIGPITSVEAQGRVDRNVVYGMYSGAALLLDVHYPTRANGFGIVFIAGSGWNSPSGYSTVGLKDSPQVRMYVPSLTEAGYTVFTVSHRATPAFRYPTAVDDVQRAVRFIRHNAVKFGIDAVRIGGSGGSSGAHLISLMGTLDGQGDPDDPDPINRESSKLQCITARAAPVDLLRMTPSVGATALALFLGIRAPEASVPGSADYKLAHAASPIRHVSKDDASTLLIHGDVDATVPFHQSEAMEAALRSAGVPVKLIRIEGGDHGPEFPGAKNPPDYKTEIVKWFDEHLRRRTQSH
jgi:acetyl esterase/lipase